MGGIDTRVLKNGVIRYRVRIRHKGLPFFSMTFDDYGAACEWLESLESEYALYWEVCHKNKASLMKEMRRNQLKVHQHIVKTRQKMC
jgi:hypothetical protein